jgi:hypothetical protein
MFKRHDSLMPMAKDTDIKRALRFLTDARKNFSSNARHGMLIRRQYQKRDDRLNRVGELTIHDTVKLVDIGEMFSDAKSRSRNRNACTAAVGDCTYRCDQIETGYIARIVASSTGLRIFEFRR